MGVKFSKEIILAREQIVPPSHHDDRQELTPVQDKLLKKLGPNAYPFTFKFPPASPCSVTLQPGEDETSKPLGVEYCVKTFVADGAEDRGHKRSSVALAIKKVGVQEQIRQAKTRLANVMDKRVVIPSHSSRSSSTPLRPAAAASRPPSCPRASPSPRARSTWRSHWTRRSTITARRSAPTSPSTTTPARPCATSR